MKKLYIWRLTLYYRQYFHPFTSAEVSFKLHRAKDEFLFLQGNVTASEFEKSNPEQWQLIREYIQRRRTFKIKQLEKLLINGEATANQIRSYDILVSIDNGTQDNGNNRHEDLYNAIFGSDKE